jgi:PEP-CTERM motif-containing protein
MRRLLTITVLSAMLMSTTIANALLINFDDVANGTVINNHYAGVTFGNPLVDPSQGLVGDIYARSTTVAESASNVVSVFATGVPAFDARWGAVEAVFATAQKSVSIDAAILRLPEGLGTVVNFPKLEIYNAAGFVTSVNWDFTLIPQPAVGAITEYQTLSYVSALDDITKVRFLSGQPGGAPSNFGLFDNLNFSNTDNGGPGNAPVPEPGTIVLLSAGLVVLGIYGRRRVKE